MVEIIDGCAAAESVRRVWEKAEFQGKKSVSVLLGGTASYLLLGAQ